MRFWQAFWLLWFVGSGCAFAAVTFVVVVRGAGEIVDMLRALRSDRENR